MVSTVTNYAKHQLSQNTTWAAKASWCVDDAGTTMLSAYGITSMSACASLHRYNTMNYAVGSQQPVDWCFFGSDLPSAPTLPPAPNTSDVV